MHRYAARLRATGAFLLTIGCSTGGAEPPGNPASTGSSLCESTEPLESPLRRLTRLEYNNTVRDLLGVDLSPADSFPPDEVAGGFANNASVLTVSPLLAEKYMEAAEALATEALKDLAALLPCDPAPSVEEACASEFVEHFGRRAYRRPLVATEIARLMRAYTAGREGADFAKGIELVIRTVLQSPSFLYRFEFGVGASSGDKLVRLTQHETATRLSYFLWNSMPDESLLEAANAGELGTKEQIAARARSMLAAPRARSAVVEFYRQWLGLGALDSLIKDAAVHPEFDDDMRAAMHAETPAFVADVLWSADRRLSTLLTAPVGFVSGPLAQLYGVTGPSSSAPQRVALDPAERAGVLTLPAVLAVHALPNQSSPVTRGKFVRERLLCQEPDPPPPNLNVTPPEVDGTRSTRERFAEHTANAACAGCHDLMDPIGFGFESYDAVGRFRTMDGGQPVDASGWIAKSEDVDGPFDNARELAEKLATSAQVRDCVATQWFRYAFGRFEGLADACSLNELRQSFGNSEGDLVELLVLLTQTEAFLHRRVLGPEEVAP